jgi:hypothetical protein
MKIRSLFLLTGLLAAGGCTLLGDFSTTQCQTDGDCLKLGPAFEGRVCSAGQCVKRESEGGIDGQAGEGGRCENATCVAELKDSPAMCGSAGNCQSLESTDCPVVWGDYRAANPVYLGFFAYLRSDLPAGSPAALNIKLAVDEINASGGLRFSSAARPVVAVVCNKADPTRVEPAARWLMETVRVPAIIGQVQTAELKKLVPMAREKDVMLLASMANDDTLTSPDLDDGGLLWHSIGDMTALAPAYKGALSWTEQRVRAGGVTGDVRVAALTASTYETQKLADQAKPLLRWNGNKSAAENAAHFMSRSIDSLYDKPGASYASVVADLVAWRPHVVIGFAGDEFALEIIQRTETTWPAGIARPHYIASPLNRYNTQLYEIARVNPVGFRSRFIGLDFSGDSRIYTSYKERFHAAFPAAVGWEGFHYLYDSVYTVAFAALGAGNPPELRGKDLARGMTKLTSGQEIVVGTKNPRDPSDTNPFLAGTSVLGRGLPIGLLGTSGAFAWDFGSGSRLMSKASIFCIDKTANGTEFRWNVLEHNPASGELEGTFDCQ